MKVNNINYKHKILNLVKICMCYSKASLGLCLVLTVVDGLMTPFMLFTVARFIDSAMTITSLYPEISKMFLYLGLTILGYLYSQVGQDIQNYSYNLLEDDLRRKLKPFVIKKIHLIDYLLFDSTETKDLLQRVTDGIEVKFVNVIRSISTALSIIIQVVGILYVVTMYYWWIALVYISIMLPTIIITFFNGRVIYQEDKKIEVITRQMNYMSDVLINREAVNERTLFGFTHNLNKKFINAHIFRSNYNTKVLARETSASTIVNMIISAFTIFCIFALSKKLPNDELSIGLFTSLIGSMINLNKLVAFQLSELILKFSNHYEYAKEFNQFMQMKEIKIGGQSIEHFTFKSLEIKNLKFKYNDSDDYILNGINLKVVQGKSYSLVGLNGAGKSTLVKIIVGLYRDYEGEIYLNGIDMQSYSFDQLNSIFSLVSQDFAKYYIKLNDNITLGNNKQSIDKVVNNLDLEELIYKLPMKENSYLGKVYEGGIDISGGEWQKIAIARTLYKNTSFMIMDEPTASLSPMAESHIYNRFVDIARDKTLLMISHRLASTKITDEIIVLDQGKIIEKGTHEELMHNNNIYSQLFRKQSEMYEKEENVGNSNFK